MMEQRELVREYYKLIIHMRQKNNENELMLCLGAGASRHWNIPNWSELVERISKNEEIGGETIYNSNLSLTSKAQALFEHYKNKRADSSDNSLPFYDDIVRMDWIKLIHKELYKNRTSDDLEHPYLYEYIKIIRNAPITINYNFDNFIEQILRKENEKARKSNSETKMYETTYRPSINFKLNKSVIYHPNGYLPETLEEGFSDHFVFSEKSFQDQLLDSIMGHYSPLMYFYSRYTALFIGVSLEDQTLRHMLRQNAVINPGHYHYYIYYMDKDLSAKEMKAIQESYFDTFNLVVLFLDENGIKQLGRCLNMDIHEFSDLLNGESLPTVLNYYISGAPGTGKTSVLDLLRNFKIFNEWPDIKHKNLDKGDNLLSKEEVIELNSWIAKQFRLKNRMVNDNQIGIQLIDRSPLDPITYAVSDGKVQDRANELLHSYRRTEADNTLVRGQIIMFTANAESVYQRLNKRNPNQYKRDWSDGKIYHFENLYDKKDVITISTSHLSIPEVAKKLAHIIYFGKYCPVDLNKYLQEYCEGTRTLTMKNKSIKDK